MAPGDRYIKVDAPTIIWIVIDTVTADGSVPHVRLDQEGTSRTITLSVSALQDRSIYKKLPPP